LDGLSEEEEGSQWVGPVSVVLRVLRTEFMAEEVKVSKSAVSS